MCPARAQVVQQAWAYLSKGKDTVSWNDLQSKFLAKEHPRVASREKLPAAVYKEFLQGFAKYVKDGCISADSFMQFYLDQNTVLPNEKDAIFCQAVSKTWGMPAFNPEQTFYQAHKPGQIADLEDVVYEKIR